MCSQTSPGAKWRNRMSSRRRLEHHLWMKSGWCSLSLSSCSQHMHAGECPRPRWGMDSGQCPSLPRANSGSYSALACMMQDACAARARGSETTSHRCRPMDDRCSSPRRVRWALFSPAHAHGLLCFTVRHSCADNNWGFTPTGLSHVLVATATL